MPNPSSGFALWAYCRLRPVAPAEVITKGKQLDKQALQALFDANEPDLYLQAVDLLQTCISHFVNRSSKARALLDTIYSDSVLLRKGALRGRIKSTRPLTYWRPALCYYMTKASVTLQSKKTRC